jgi:hypothetical protein
MYEELQIARSQLLLGGSQLALSHTHPRQSSGAERTEW